MEEIELLIKEVEDLVQMYSDGREVWTIYNGVDAFEVLIGYTSNPYIIFWLQSLSDNAHYQVYPTFIRQWNVVHPSPFVRVDCKA